MVLSQGQCVPPTPKGYLLMSGDICGCCDWGGGRAPGIKWHQNLEAKDAAQHPTVHRMLPKQNQPQMSTVRRLGNPGLTPLLSKEKNPGLKGPLFADFFLIYGLWHVIKNDA